MITNHELRDNITALSKNEKNIFEVSKYKWENIIKKVVIAFGNITYTSPKDIHWLWNGNIKNMTFSTFYINDDFYKELEKIYNDDFYKYYYFIVEDNFDKYWVYEATPEVIQKLIPNLPFFEYYIVDKKFESLICENHHGTIFFSGNIFAKYQKNNTL